eukprot:6200918-Pleurochrysis_carterae.AAC.1
MTPSVSPALPCSRCSNALGYTCELHFMLKAGLTPHLFRCRIPSSLRRCRRISAMAWMWASPRDPHIQAVDKRLHGAPHFTPLTKNRPFPFPVLFRQKHCETRPPP